MIFSFILRACRTQDRRKGRRADWKCCTGDISCNSRSCLSGPSARPHLALFGCTTLLIADDVPSAIALREVRFSGILPNDTTYKHRLRPENIGATFVDLDLLNLNLRHSCSRSCLPYAGRCSHVLQLLSVKFSNELLFLEDSPQEIQLHHSTLLRVCTEPP